MCSIHTLVSWNHQHLYDVSSVLYLVVGSALLTHCILGAGFPDNVRLGNGVDAEKSKETKVIQSTLLLTFLSLSLSLFFLSLSIYLSINLSIALSLS